MTDDREHIRASIGQVLFTEPGERVDRPDFGAGLRQFLFEPITPELATAVQHAVRRALNRWMSEVIELEDVQVIPQDSTLCVSVQYVVRSRGERLCDVFYLEEPAPDVM